MSKVMSHHGKNIVRTSGIIDRPRLLQKLESVWEYRLTLISAPPGYGKTTVVNQFAREASQPIIWHTLDERQRDVPNLQSQCLAALSRHLPEIGLLAQHSGYAASELATLVTDYLHENLTEDIVYILDDVHNIAGAASAEAWLRTLVALAPPNCHLIIMSRILPNLSLIEMIARGEVLAIGQEDLRLSPDEIQALGQTILRSTPPDPTTQQLLERLEGWPAGTVLALQPLPSDFERAILSGNTGPEALFDALAETMLQNLPLNIRDFALASSTLTRITPELCTVALKLTNSAQLLVEAQARNLFLASVPGGLVYHMLFRNLLQRQLRASAPARFTTLHTRAAEYFEENDSLDEAFYHYAEVGAFSRAAAIAERIAQAYFAQGKVETLLAWNTTLSQAEIPAPRLLYQCAMVHIERYEYADAEDALDRVEAAFAKRIDQEGLTLVSLQRAFLNAQRGDYPLAIALATPLAQLPEGPDNIRGRALNILGFCQLQMGDTPAALQLLRQALPLYRTYADAHAQSFMLLSLAHTCWRIGRLQDALAHLQEVVALRRSLGGASLLAAALTHLGFYYGQFGDYIQAAATLQEGLSAVARSPNKRFEAYLLHSLGNIRRFQGSFDEAQDHYQKSLDLLEDNEPSLRALILTNFSNLRRWQGNLSEAIDLAEQASEVAESHNIRLEVSNAQTALWTARAELGESALALSHLEQIADDLRDQHEQFALLRTLGLCAHVNLLASDKVGALRYLQAAFALAQEIGTTQPLLSEVMHAPLLEAQINKNSKQYARLISDLQQLRKLEIKPSSSSQSPSMPGPLTFSLRVLTLGQERIFRDGVPVISSEWRPAAREMFYYLLFAGPSTRESISLLFWPDSLPKHASGNVHTALYYTRRALGESVVSFEGKQYSINPDVEVWCDARELQHLVAQARLLSPHDARAEDLWHRAANLYHGEFLPGLSTDWVLPYREALYEANIDALIGMAECARARGDLREALARFKRASELEPYREDIHQAIMSCYAARGATQKVLDHFQEVQKLFRQDLTIEPSSKTLNFVKDLLR